jgi:hypothetical protein
LARGRAQAGRRHFIREEEAQKKLNPVGHRIRWRYRRGRKSFRKRRKEPQIFPLPRPMWEHMPQTDSELHVDRMIDLAIIANAEIVGHVIVADVADEQSRRACCRCADLSELVIVLSCQSRGRALWWSPLLNWAVDPARCTKDTASASICPRSIVGRGVSDARETRSLPLGLAP